MKPTIVAPVLAIEDDDWDRQDCFDVFHPEFDARPGETLVAFNIRYAFTCAGYRVTNVEKPESHPVLIVRAVRETAPRITDHRLFFREIQRLLRDSGLRLKYDELSISRIGNRLIVAFQTGGPRADLEKILLEPHEDMADHGELPA